MRSESASAHGPITGRPCTGVVPERRHDRVAELDLLVDHALVRKREREPRALRVGLGVHEVERPVLRAVHELPVLLDEVEAPVLGDAGRVSSTESGWFSARPLTGATSRRETVNTPRDYARAGSKRCFAASAGTSSGSRRVRQARQSAVAGPSVAACEAVEREVARATWRRSAPAPPRRCGRAAISSSSVAEVDPVEAR